MIRLWGRDTSSNVKKVTWLLEELGLAYERLDVGGPFGGTSTPQYRAMQPLGLVPAYEEDGFTLFESNAILRFVCSAHAPDSRLYPAHAQTRAKIEAWMDFQQTSLNNPQSRVFVGLVRTASENRDATTIRSAIEHAAAIWAVLDKRLADRPYIGGDDLTLADMAFGPHVHRWYNMDFDPPAAPHLRAWYDRLLARPAFVAQCAGPVV